MFVQKKYYPQLDAIRGISVLAVFFYHAFKPNLEEGFINNGINFFLNNLFFGLDIFFILSSFLLTFLGIIEYQKIGSFSLKNFFLRRTLRIWPLYFLIMFFSFVILKQIQNHYGTQITLPPASWYLFFVSNFYFKEHVFFLRLLWTLSVEEQFYLLWGICLTFFQKKIKIVILTFTIISVVFNYRGAYYEKSIYYNTLSYLLDMMIGAYAAYSLIFNNNVFKFLYTNTKKYELLLYLFLPILFFSYYLINNYILNGGLHRVLEETIRQIFLFYCSLIIIHQMCFEHSKFSLSKKRVLTYLGKISFGIYIYHGIVITLVSILLKQFAFTLPSIIFAISNLAITVALSSVSYKFFEYPILKLKNRFRLSFF